MSKVRVTFKDSDALGFLDHNAISNSLKDKFIQWNEYITVEFDNQKGTCRVVPLAEYEDADAAPAKAIESALSDPDEPDEQNEPNDQDEPDDQDEQEDQEGQSDEEQYDDESA